MSTEKPKKESVKEELKADVKKIENKFKRKPKAQAPVKPEEKK